MTPRIVAISEPSSARMIEVWNAPRIDSLANSLSYHCRLTPSIGKAPLREALNDSSMTTMMGANWKI
jgi:hypothetical protein